MKTNTHDQSGLSLVEVLFIVVTVAAVLAVLLPMLTRPRPKGGTRIRCTSNLKQVGLAYRLWSNDHEDQFPFASTKAESSMAWVNSPQVFRHFQVMSNELVTPKVLVCPNDSRRTKTADFVNFANTNLSYFVGLDAHEAQPQSILSGDRNITGGTLSNGFMRRLSSNSLAGWETNLHQGSGNLGLGDGSVQQVTAQSLQRQLQAQPLPVIRVAIP